MAARFRAKFTKARCLPKRDSNALRSSPALPRKLEKVVKAELEAREDADCSASEIWPNLICALQKGLEVLPVVPTRGLRRWKQSQCTQVLLSERERYGPNISSEEQTILARKIAHSAKDDHRQHITLLVEKIE